MNTHVESPASENRENLEEMRGSVGGGSRESKHVPLRDGHIYWRRIVAEALAIVASILLAFAIDTWWERRGLAREETVVLQGLLADFQSTAARAAAVRANSQDMLDAATELLRATGPTTTIPPDSASRLLGRMIALGTAFVPVEGTLASLIASEGLGRISDPALRAKLAEWPQHVSGVQRPEARRNALMDNQLMPYLHARVPVRTLDMLANPSLPSGASRFPIDMNLLVTDPHFENLVNDFLFATVAIMTRLERAESALNAILVDIRAGI